MEKILIAIIIIGGLFFCVIVSESAQKNKAHRYGMVSASEYGKIKRMNYALDDAFCDLTGPYQSEKINYVKSKLAFVLEQELKDYGSDLIKLITNRYQNNIYYQFKKKPIIYCSSLLTNAIYEQTPENVEFDAENETLAHIYMRCIECNMVNEIEISEEHLQRYQKYKTDLKIHIPYT